MKVIDVPVYNEDGSVQCTMLIGPDEAKGLLQFAVNFLASVGHREFFAKQVAAPVLNLPNLQ